MSLCSSEAGVRPSGRCFIPSVVCQLLNFLTLTLLTFFDGMQYTDGGRLLLQGFRIIFV